MTKVRLKTRRFRQLLVERGISQNRLATIAGLTSGFMSQLLTGARNPSYKTRNKLMEAVNRPQRLKGAKEYEFSDVFRLTK